MSGKSLQIGDLVWAKMKNFPYWPAKIMSPPETKCFSHRKSDHYVYFFGSKNYARISNNHIVSHSEDMISSCKKKRPGAVFQNAVDEIVKAALEKKSASEKNADSKYSGDVSEMSQVSEPKNVRKIKMKNTIVKTKKRQLFSETDDKKLNSSPLSHVQKLDNLSSSLSVNPTDDSQIAVNKMKNTIVKTKKRQLSSETDDKKLNSSPLSHVPKVQKLDNLSSSLSVNRTDDSQIAVFSPCDDASKSQVSTYSGSSSTPQVSTYSGSSLPSRSNIDPAISILNGTHPCYKIGFLGLGVMGQAIVKCFLKKGLRVFIWNRTSSVCDEFVEDGAIKCKSPKDVVEAVNVTFGCVSDSKAVKNIVFGVNGVLSGLKASKGKKGYVELSSIDAATSEEIAKAIVTEGGRYLEAPILGNKETAEVGQILVCGAGDVTLFRDCEMYFRIFAKYAIFESMIVGVSARFNLIHSTLMGTLSGALAEAFALAKSFNISQELLLDISVISGLPPVMFEDKGQAMLNETFTVNNSLKYQQKDVSLALSMSNDLALPMPVATSANELYKQAKRLGYSNHDVAAVYRAVRHCL